MSLINDALKRASQSDRNRQRPAQTHTPMEPAAHSAGRPVSLVLGVSIILAIGLAGWFFGQWWQASRRAAPVVARPAVVAPAPPSPRPAPAPAPPVVAHEAVVPLPVIAPVSPPVVAPTPQPAKPVAKAWPVELKLMGIFFSKTNPKALINGQTLSVGEEIEGIRVTKIEQDQVTLEWEGQVKRLIME